MPYLYASPGKSAGTGKTYLRSFAGSNAFIPIAYPQEGNSPAYNPWAKLAPGTVAERNVIASFTDGTAHTIFVAEAVEPTEWTNPNELPFLEESGWGQKAKPYPPPKLGGVFDGGFHAIMVDGRVHFFPDTLDEPTVRSLLTREGGEVQPDEVFYMIWPTGTPGRRPGSTAR